ncbi:Alpha- and gamma-adaptin-binding protein p34 [Globisporangium polare]
MEPPPPLPLLASAVVVGRSHHVEALPHVVERISALLDSVALERWSVPRACEQNDLRLLHRVAAREPHEMDPHYKKLLASQGLVAAVRNNSLQIVSWLCLEYCPPLIPMKAIEEAARLGKSDILEWLFANHKSALWTKKIAGAAVENGHLVVLQLALPHIETGEVVAELHCRAAQCGHLEVVSWLHGHRTQSQLSTTALDFTGVWDQRVLLNTILAGHFEVAQFLVSKGYPLVIDRYRHVGLSASWGNLEMIRWLLTIPEAKRSTGWIDGAAGAGHLHMVKWAHKNLKNDRCSENAMDNAATNGHLELVQWLHINRSEGCRARAMDLAASEGHLGVVQWLHENRSEGCTSDAMDYAAKNGHLDVVKWLHENRTEGCTIEAMDNASSLPVTQWLQENRTEGCTIYAMENATRFGCFDTLLYLHANRNEGPTHRTALCAVASNSLEIFEWVYATYRNRVNLDRIAARCGWKPNAYASALVEQMRSSERE